MWRDVWNAVSSIYYNMFHSLEEDGMLNPANSTHLFCAQYVFLPRIQTALDAFTDGWNSHAISTENNRTPNQLWEIGKIQSPVPPAETLEVTSKISHFVKIQLDAAYFYDNSRYLFLQTFYSLPLNNDYLLFLCLNIVQLQRFLVNRISVMLVI